MVTVVICSGIVIAFYFLFLINHILKNDLALLEDIAVTNQQKRVPVLMQLLAWKDQRDTVLSGYSMGLALSGPGSPDPSVFLGFHTRSCKLRGQHMGPPYMGSHED